MIKFSQYQPQLKELAHAVHLLEFFMTHSTCILKLLSQCVTLLNKVRIYESL